jgi:hypothetical protein
MCKLYNPILHLKQKGVKGMLCTMVKHNPVLHLEQAVGGKSGKMYSYFALEVRG